MQGKIKLMALGVIASVAILSAPDVGATEAKSTKKTKQKDSHKVVTVKTGDTLSSIAKSNKTTYVKLFNANKDIANPDQIDVGDKIRIPKKDEKLADRFSKYQASIVAVAAPATTAAAPVASAPVVAQTSTSYTTRNYTSAPVNSNSYYVGNGMWCTDYVHSKRPDVAIYGNAGYNWMSAAQAEGKSTGSTPKAGAVAVMDGHVAYVEKVNSDGSYVVSEMGWNYQAGNFNRRTVQPGAFGGFIY